MSTETQTQKPKEKYEDLLKEIRLQKSIPVLEKIYDDLKINKDNLFNDAIIPFKFSTDFIWFLKYNLISAKIQMDIFKLYIDSFMNLKWNSENLNQMNFLFEIFNYDSNFFNKASTADNFLNFLNGFFNQYYPKDTSIKHQVGDYMDVYITEERKQVLLPTWVQLKIKKIDEEKKIYYFDDCLKKNKEIIMNMDNFSVQEKNTFVKEEEMAWRNNLKKGDILDYLNDKNNWIEAKVEDVVSDTELSLSTFGQQENTKITVNKYSPYIQPYLKFSFEYEEDEMNCLAFIGINTYFQRFNYILPCTKNNHLVPNYDLKFYSLEYYDLINFFINKMIETKILLNESLSIEYIYTILNILMGQCLIVNQKFIGDYIYKNCFENIKKILIKFSLDKKINKSKNLIENILNNLQALINFIFYPYQLTNFFNEFTIEFGYNCFKNSESLEKRLLGLNTLRVSLDIVYSFFIMLPNRITNKISSLINSKILTADENNNDLFGLLFSDPNIHEQLLLKGVEVIKILPKLKLLVDKDIERLYSLSFCSQPESELFKSIFSLLNNISKDMELSQQKIIFKKIIELPYEKIREDDMILMSYILQNIKEDNDFKEMAQTFLDFYYNYIITFHWKKYDKTPLIKFSRILTYAKSEDNFKFLFCHYFEKIINDLNKQNSLKDYKFYWDFVRYIINQLNKKDEKIQSYLPYIKIKFREIFLEKNKNMEIIVDKLLELNNKNNNEIIDEKNNEENITDIVDNIQSLLNFIKENNFYTVESMKKLSEYYFFGDVLRPKRSKILYKIIDLKEEDSVTEQFLEYFFNRFDKFLDEINPENPEKYKLLDDSLISCIADLYYAINKPKEEKIATDADINKFLNNMKKYTTKQNPLKSRYIDIIWKMFLKYNYCDELKEFLELFELKNFSPSERHEIWEQLVQKIFENIDNNIPLSLKMLDIIIIISEIYGSGGAKAHYIDLKKKVKVKLKVHNDISNLLPEFNFSNKDDEIFYSTDTLYDIKKKIKIKYGIDPIFLEVDKQKSKIFINFEVEDNKALYQFYPGMEKRLDDEFDIYFKRGKIFNILPEYPFNSGNGVTLKFEQVLREIFNRYAKDNKLDINSYKKYFSDSMRVEASEEMKKASLDAFHKYDTDNNGYWTFENFSLFFIVSLQNKKNAIKTNLTNLGYSPNLDSYIRPLDNSSPLYYEENNVKEFMPRYFIGNNKQYMEILFTYAKMNDKGIVQQVQSLLQELCTLEEMKKSIFEKSDKIEEIISNNNLELRGYAFDILLQEFEKEEKDQNKENLVKNFINNNLNKLIIELDKFSNENDKDKDKEENIFRYFNFYLSNLKIIFYTFKYIIDDKDVIDTIEKYESLDDDNRKNTFKKTTIELNQDKINLAQNIKLSDLLTLIGNNIIKISDKDEEIYRTGMHLSVKILIYIIILSQNISEKEKIEIYKKYIYYEAAICQTYSFYIKSLFHTSNKVLLNFMNNETDKKYILTKFDELSKEIILYDKLNLCDWKLSTYINIIIDVFDISSKGIKNEKIFSLFETLFNLVLDKNIELKEFLLNGYLKIIKKVLTILKDENYNKLYEYNFETIIPKMINEFIITFDTNENNQINEIENLKNYSKYSNYEYVENIFQILSIILSLNPDKYLKLFFLNEDMQNLPEKHLTKIDESLSEYNPFEKSRYYNQYSGLKNLSSICYMNSVLQQFFMIPLFRNAILSLPIPKDLDENKEDNDNLLFQLIRMFYYLNYSDKGDYNPKYFVFSFKDYEGNPTRIDIQCDAQEFLSRFIEKVEECLKNDKQQFLCNNILGGTTLQQVKCTNPECGNISERKENINFLSVDIKNVGNIDQCLNKFTKEETIEDYHCEKCNKKITHIKHVLIDKIPNILIIHLQRIAFSYETFNMEKINTHITFEKTLNIKRYTVNKENPEIPSEYYDYDLQGILIHSGTAQYGHYYSIILNTEAYSEYWYKFNDSQVNSVDYNTIISDAYGNSGPYAYGSSAYMLIYQKRTKKPVIIDSKELDENIKKILDEKKEQNLDKIQLDNGNIYYIYETEKDAIEKNVEMKKDDNDIHKLKENKVDKNIIIKNNSIQAKLVSFEEALNLLQKENNEGKDKKPFLKNILLENVKICNDKKFYTESFISFMKESIYLIKEEIITDKTNQKINEYVPILKSINDYVLHIFSYFNNLVDTNIIIHNVLDIYEQSVPKELLSYLIKDFIEKNKDNLYINYFCNRDNKKGEKISCYIGRIISCCINNSIENETAFNIIKFYLDKIPVEITKKWTDMEGFNNFILILVQNSNLICKYFINNEIISKLIDLILGKESPLYEGDERIENKNNKPKFGNIIKSIALLYKYYVDNYQKEELNLSKNDIIMINTVQFYEKVVMEDYDNEACNMLLENKIDIDLALNKEENKDDFDNNIIDILIKLKIPSLKTNDEIASGINLITNLIQKYAEIYNINNKVEENNDKNNEKFIEKLNILLGIPVPSVTEGVAEIKYVSGLYHDKFTILTNLSTQKEKNKEFIIFIFPLLNLFNLNKLVFDYLNKLPSPNSSKYSFFDYYMKLYFSIEKEIDDEKLEKDYNNLITEIFSKNNKDINTIKNNEQIDIENSLHFHELYFNTISNLTLPEKVKLFQSKLYYITGKNVPKTELPCFTTNNYFTNLIQRNSTIMKENKNGYKIHCMLCIILYSEKEQDININFKPYFHSTFVIKAKKENHYFLFCNDIEDNIILNDDEIDKLIDYTNLNIKTEETKVEALPQANNNQVSNDECAINCPVCGSVNVLNEGNPEYKCVFCESPLF